VIDAQRFARLVTDAVIQRPVTWQVFRRPLRSMFEGLAPTWETRIGPHHLWALDLALEDVLPPRGAETPIYVPPERLSEDLGRRGFAEFAVFSAEPATALRAKRR